MPNNFSAAVQPYKIIGTNTSAANTSVTATAAAPGAGFKWNVTGFDVSSPGTIAAGVTATLVRTLDGATETGSYGIPGAQVAPVGRDFSGPALDCDANTAVTCTVPALGAGVVGIVNIYGRKIAVG